MLQENKQTWWLKLSSPRTAVPLFILIVSLLAARGAYYYRTPVAGSEAWGLSDFQHTIYYPTRAFLAGINPYSVDYVRSYPVKEAVPLYLPLSWLVHVPFAGMNAAVSGCLYFLFTVVMSVALMRLCLNWTLGHRIEWYNYLLAGTLLLSSRPGHLNLLLGQMTVQIVFASYLALRFADTRPILSGLCLALACCKPTFGGPLAVLMLTRREYRAVFWGAGIAGGSSLACVLVLASCNGGLGAFIDAMRENYRYHLTDATVVTHTSWVRIDIASFLGHVAGRDISLPTKFIAGSAILGLAGLTNFRVKKPNQSEIDTGGLSVAITLLATLICIYHSNYDAILLCLPICALFANRDQDWQEMPVLMRRFLLVSLLMPALNYFSTEVVLTATQDFMSDGVRTFITSINSGFLLTAFLVMVHRALSVTHERRSPGAHQQQFVLRSTTDQERMPAETSRIPVGIS